MTTTAQNAQLTQAPQSTGSLVMIGTLGGIALVSGLLLALVYHGTYDTIQRNNYERTAEAVLTLLPGAVSQKMFAVHAPGPNGDATPQNIYAGYDADGNLMGVALEALDNGGYGGEIRLLYGYLPDKEIVTGMRVLLSKETPGLGDRIKTDPGFQKNFNGLDVSLDPDTRKPKNPISYTKPGTDKEPWQVEGISGATISSQAVARAMRNSVNTLLPIVHEMLDELRKGGKS
ncbi:MAG TPA: RnfABCDGE type electron transport complex subunit G [Candidatus Hydrogenedentes bacterium]|nr:RnfABCDGE type electron transport complex subunit G [Candidatus Hydrogenedentota bacterium]